MVVDDEEQHRFGSDTCQGEADARTSLNATRAEAELPSQVSTPTDTTCSVSAKPSFATTPVTASAGAVASSTPKARASLPSISAPALPTPSFQNYQTNATLVTKAAKKLSTADGTTSTTSTGRWTREEHEQFLEGLKIYGREWKKVAKRIPTRTSAQIRSHAQKYFAKIMREEEQRATTAAVSSPPGAQRGGLLGLGGLLGSREGINSSLNPHQSLLLSSSPVHLSSSAMAKVGRILSDPEGLQHEVEDTLAALQRRYDELQRQIYHEQRVFGSRRNEIDGGAHKLQVEASKGNAPSAKTQSDGIDVTTKGKISSKRRRTGGIALADKTTGIRTQESSAATSQTYQHCRGQQNAEQREQIIESRDLWSQELIALSVLGGSLQQSGSGGCRAQTPSITTSGGSSAMQTTKDHSSEIEGEGRGSMARK